MASAEGRSLEAAAASRGSALKFKTGNMIVTADRPLAHVLAHIRRKECCDNCYKFGCSKCKRFQYCDKKCHTEDWKSFHKHGECDLYHELLSVPDSEFEELMGLHYSRLFLRTHLLLKAKPELMHQKFLMHDKTERSLAEVPVDADTCEHHTNVFVALCDVLKQVDHQEENLPALVSLFHKIRKNFVLIKRGEVGLALYVPITGLKHSCRPNAGYVFKGKKLEVRAMRDIAEGEDVTIDLTHIMKPLAGRQKDLIEWRGMICDCDRCREGDQKNEVTDLTAHVKYRESLSRHYMSSDRVLTSPRAVFDGFMSQMEITERYEGRYHPDFVLAMCGAAAACYVVIW